MKKIVIIILISLVVCGCGKENNSSANSNKIQSNSNDKIDIEPSKVIPFIERSSLKIQDAVKPIPAIEHRGWVSQGNKIDGEPPLFKMSWARVLYPRPKSDRGSVLITCHSLSAVCGYLIRIYSEENDLYKPRYELQFGFGYLEKSEHFEDSRHGFMLFRHDAGGSDSYWTNRIISLGPMYAKKNDYIEIKEIEIEQPVNRLKHLISPDQRSDQESTRIDYDFNLEFSFPILKKGERKSLAFISNVTGTFKLLFDDHKRPLRFVVDKWKAKKRNKKP